MRSALATALLCARWAMVARAARCTRQTRPGDRKSIPKRRAAPNSSPTARPAELQFMVPGALQTDSGATGKGCLQANPSFLLQLTTQAKQRKTALTTA